MKRKKEEVLQIEYHLTQQELLVVAKTLSAAMEQKDAVEAKLKNYKDQVKAEVSGLEAEIQKAYVLLNRGTEFRDIECNITYDWDTKTKYWHRKDNGDFVKDDIIPEHERQEEMELNAEELSSVPKEEVVSVKQVEHVPEDNEVVNQNYEEE